MDWTGWEWKEREGRDESPKTSLKFTLVNGVIPHSEPSMLSMISLFRLMIKAWKPV